MTRNQFVADNVAAMHLAYIVGRMNGTIKEPFMGSFVTVCKAIADDLESAGCAPWQDAPTVSAPIQFDLPTRREITAADVQPGAVFTDEDGDNVRIDRVNESKAEYRFNSGQQKLEEYIYLLVKQLNNLNATVTPPTA
jgi:hypothetical protein